MADSDFGQLWAELVMENRVSPQLEQIIKDFQLVDNSIRETRKHLEAFADVKLTNGINDVEKNWRSMRGAISDVQTDIDKLRIKMANLNDAGFGSSSEYKKYEDSLRKLIALKYEMLEMGKNGQTRASILGSEDVTRFKQELSLSRKEIANTDVAAKHLVDTQRQNVGAVEKMVSQYDKMLNTLKSARQEALDSGMTTMGTQWLQNTVNRIQAVSDTLRQALNNPSAITNNMVQQAEQQFSHLEQMAKTHAERIRNTLTAKQIMTNSQLELTKMETGLERIKNKLAAFREDKKITVNTTDLDTARQKLEDFLTKYRSILSSGSISKSTAKALAAEFNQIAAEAEKAEVKVRGLYDTEKRRLSTTTSPAKPIIETANALRQAQSAFDPVIQKMQQLQSATTRTGVIWEQFKTQIAFTAFSIYGLEHFLKSIITVGGEFERQRVALQNMLGDMREATEIFGQLKNLALESPFTFRQLSTYTKQLAAFSIPYEELYDTNRRLSDMSAGLGVDMSRLILAYGQVRAATVLRGQELRQFTEAGVPMVEKLADYFTKLNGELVTTRDIFTMISKKQVPFEAVRAVMQEMTDEGGMFYNMQAKIADTLSGRWNNLKDAWEILLGELADSESLIGSVLKTFVEGIAQVIRSLRSVLGVIGGLAAGRVLSGIAPIFVNSLAGGKTSLERQALQAKRLVAVDLQRKAIMQGIDDHEKDIIRTRNQLLAADYKGLVVSGQLDKYQTMMLVKRRKITASFAEQALLEQGISAFEVHRLQNMSKLQLITARLGDAMKAMLFNPATIITGAVMAIGAVLGAWLQYSHKLEEARNNLAEQATQTRNDLSQFLSNDKFNEDMGDEEAKRAIERYEEELKKIAPNFLEIKSRIVGEHGESPQEQAKAYRDELQSFFDNSDASEYAARRALENNDRGFGRDTFIEKADAFYKEMGKINDEILRLDPKKFSDMVYSMEALNDASKAQVVQLIEQGKKLEAIRKLKLYTDKMGPGGVEYPDDAFYSSFNAIWNNLFYDTDVKKQYNDASNEFFSKMKEDIKNNYSNYFDKDGKWIGPITLRDSLIKGIRDGLSQGSASPETMQGSLMQFEYDVFGSSISTAMDALANRFVTKNATLVAKFKSSQGEVTDEVKKELYNQAENLALIDPSFYQHLDYIFNGRGFNEVVKRIRVILGLEDPDLKQWQQELANKFDNNPDYMAVIKASADIPSALDAIEKLYKEAKEKMRRFGGIELPVNLNIKTPTPLKTEGKWWENLLPWQQEAVQQYNESAKIMELYNKNRQSLGLKEPKLKGEKTPKKTGRKEDKELQAWQRHVELYKKFLDQYRELTKMYGEKEALDKLQTSKAYEWVISFAKARGLDATDIDSMNAALNGILDTNKGDKQKRKDAMAKRTADLEAEGYKRAEEALRRLNDQLNEQLKILNDQYDAYKKIFLITGNKEGSMQLAFGGNVTTERYVDELTERLKDALKTAGSSLSIDDAISLNKEEINKRFGEESEAANLINKLKEERNKLEKEYIDILANALTSDMSLEDKRAEAVRKYNEELRKLIALRDKAETAEGKAQAQAGIDALTNTHNRNMANYDQQIFERNTSIHGALNNINVLSKGYLRALLVGLRDNMSKLANDNTQEGLQMREKLAEQIMKVTDALNDLNDSVSNLDDDFYTSGDGTRHITGVTATRYGMQQGQEIDQEMENLIRMFEQLRKFTTAMQKASKIINDLSSVLKPVSDLFEALGGDRSGLNQFMNTLSSASKAMQSTSSLAESLKGMGGNGGNLAGMVGKAAPYVAIAAAVITQVTNMVKAHQQAIQREIDASKQRQKEMEDLSNHLKDALEHTLGSVYEKPESDAMLGRFMAILKPFGSTVTASNIWPKYKEWFDLHDQAAWRTWSALAEKTNPVSYRSDTKDAMKKALETESYYDQSFAALLVQRDEILYQLKQEQNKKSPDDSAISEYNQQLLELNDNIETFALDMAKAIYDIDLNSWSSELTDAIVDAWASGEDAAEAYKKKVNEIIKSLTKNILAQKVLQRALDDAGVDDIIKEEMVNKSGRLDENSAIRVANALMEASDSAIGNVTLILDKLREAGWDLSDAENNASTLGKGIASITEDTADLLASYINAIRADVAAIRAFEERILESGFTDINSNLALQLTELRNISAFAERNAIAAERILEMFDSVTTVGSSGRKVRV